MRETWKAARVGLMVILGVAAIVAVFRFVDETTAEGAGYQVTARFDDAQGLIPKSRVVIAGIPVGTIEDIALEGNQARVTIQVDEGVELHEDAAVAMRQESLLGEQILVINPGTIGRPMLPAGGELRVASEGVTTADILEQVDAIATDVRAITGQLSRAFGTDEAGDRFESILANLSDSLETVNRTLQRNEPNIDRTLDGIASTVTRAEDPLVAALENISAATLEVKELLQNRRGDLDNALAEADDTIVSIRRASEQLEGVLGDVRVVTDRTARGEGTIGRLFQDETVVDEVEGAAAGLNNLIGGLARLQTILEIRSEYNFLAQTFKTYFSLRLAPREGRYFFIQLVDDPRGTVRRTQSVVRRQPAGPEEVPEQLVETETRSEDFRFTIQLAKRVSFATFRFGIMESTGGLGLDLHVFDDRFELNTDMFAFGENFLPRLRVRAGFELVKKLYIVAGIDDALNGAGSGINGRDFFAGLQFRFNDQDLRGLLPFLGGAI
ncbi:MAG: MlaD family protein [Myxococcota bacterium]